MGTRIDVSSTLGVGSRFSVRLPLATESSVTEASTVLETAPDTPPSRLIEEPRRRKRLLFRTKPIDIPLILELLDEVATRLRRGCDEVATRLRRGRR